MLHELPRGIVRVLLEFMERCKKYYRTENIPEGVFR